MHEINRIAVYGAGSWGTALAIQLARNGVHVNLWGHRPEHLHQLAESRENAVYLPGTPLPERLMPVSDLAQACKGVDAHLVVVPSQGFRSFLETLKPLLSDPVYLAWATKGLDIPTGKLLSQVVGEVLHNISGMALISGPSFAAEVASGMPTAITVAGDSPAFTQALAGAFHADRFRCYTSHDLVGVQIGGAIKNILAIATGISDGMGFGANARAAIITRGLAEVSRLASALGAQSNTMMGLAGLGDLVLSATDDQSRNRQLGLRLGRGEDLQDALAAINQSVEGVKTAKSIGLLASRHQVEMPICNTISAILFEQLPLEQALSQLLNRQARAESEEHT